MFRRYPFTLGIGFAIVFGMLVNFLFFAIAFVLHWESHTQAEKSFMSIASFFGTICSFVSSLCWTHNPLDPHSMLTWWYRPLALLASFVLFAWRDYSSYRREGLPATPAF